MRKKISVVLLLALLVPLTVVLVDWWPDLMRLKDHYYPVLLPELNTVEECLTTLEDDDQAHRQLAVARLGEFGPKAKAAIPALTRLLKDDPSELVRIEVVWALQQIAPNEAAPDLLRELQSSDPHTRNYAAILLGEEGVAVEHSLPALSALLAKDGEAMVRASAARSLGHLGEEGARAPLLKACRDPDANVRDAAAAGLAELGLSQEEIRDALQLLLGTPSTRPLEGAKPQ